MPEPEPNAPAVTIELDRMHLLACTDGDALLAEALLDEFIDNLADYIAQLAEARHQGQWRDGAHRIKGAARGVGALALAATTALIEEAPPEDSAASKAALMRLHAHLQALRALSTGSVEQA